MRCWNGNGAPCVDIVNHAVNQHMGNMHTSRSKLPSQWLEMFHLLQSVLLFGWFHVVSSYLLKYMFVFFSSHYCLFLCICFSELSELTWASARLAILAELKAECPEAPRVLAVAPKKTWIFIIFNLGYWAGKSILSRCWNISPEIWGPLGPNSTFSSFSAAVSEETVE